MNESRYYVWCPSLGPFNQTHPTIDEARAEARRLCQLPPNHGKEFFVLRVIESVQYRTDPFVCRNFCRSE